jgi:tRNA(Ile)-lysidine synthase
MRHIARLVARTIARHALVGPEDRVAVAVSGGPDSVALAWLLREIAADAGWSIAGLIHVHHGLRGADADADEAFVRTLAARLHLPIEVAHVDVGASARAARRSIEATARDLRYVFFEDAARRLGATRVATGHSLDDQAETVLLRLLRGAGGRGVTGIRVRRGLYIRPLLECRRSELRRYLRARDESFREDATNQDRSIARNRVRHDLLPVIEHLAPGGLRALARFAQISADDEAFLEGLAIEAARTLVLFEDGGVQVNRGGLCGLPPPVARRLVRRVVETAAPGVTVTRRHVEAVRRLATADKPDGHLDLPDASVDRRGDLLVVRAGHARAVQPPAFELGLPVPGEVELPASGGTIQAIRPAGADNERFANGAPDTAVLQAASVTLPLAVRNRRPGDRLRPLGAPGRRKVQDVLVDRKVPRHERDRVPIVVDAAGRIVWVAGLVIADECRVTAPEAGVVILKLRRT